MPKRKGIPSGIACHGCGKPGFRSFDDRSFTQHLRQCPKNLLKPSSGDAVLELNDWRLPTFLHPRDDTDRVPTFTLDRYQNKDTPAYRLGPIESHYALDEMMNGTSSHLSGTRENSSYPMSDDVRWELNSDSFDDPYDHDDVEVAWSDDSEDYNDFFPEEDDDDDSAYSLHVKKPFEKVNNVIPANTTLTIELADILQKHGSNLKMQDDIVDLINAYTSSGRLNQDTPPLSRRAPFLKSMEKEFKTTSMKPKHIDVVLEDQSTATVLLFDLENMIKTLLMDESLMADENLAEGYDIFTGETSDEECNNNYGEIHTGDAWDPARLRFCGKDGKYMPISLIIFGDKTHTDLHGSLSVTPIIFTLSLFNSKARNRPEFWRPLAYIPNLSHGKSKADNKKSLKNLRNEHRCLAAAFQPVIDLHMKGGMQVLVKKRMVTGKIWIHFFIGDTAGNNAWLCHYNGSGRVCTPYRDCTCDFLMMSHDNPTCSYINLDDMRYAKITKANDNKEGTDLYKRMSKHDVRNILTDPNLPLSDKEHGPYRMMPPELLHTSGSGLIMYIFKALRVLFGNTVLGMAAVVLLDRLHKRISFELSRQSDRDLPRGSVKNGVLDVTKCQSHERIGNLVRLLYLAYTTSGRSAMKEYAWLNSARRRKKFILFIKLYVAMEQWFHESNPKEQVRRARSKIAFVLKLMKELFPRSEGQGYNIPKHHGMTKMQYYMCLFGSGINFFGGPGESHHKWFVKYPGGNTQRRVGEFARQVANRIYETMVIDIAKSVIKKREQDDFEMINLNSTSNIIASTESLGSQEEVTSVEDPVTHKLRGGYTLTVTSTTLNDEKSSLRWHYKNKAKSIAGGYGLREDFLQVVYREIRERDLSLPISLKGYTEMHMKDDERSDIFRAHPKYLGTERYDWGFVDYSVDEDVRSHYPALVLGFINLPEHSDSDTMEELAVVRTSINPVAWGDVEKDFVHEFMLSSDLTQCHVAVPIQAIVYPLIVFHDHGGNKNKFFITLPKRSWAKYFSDQIRWRTR